MDGERLEVAHNGVRGDNVVGVREARRVSSGITNQTREDVIMSVRSLIGIGLCALLSLLGGNSVFAQEPAPAPVSTSTVQERLDVLEKKSDAPGLWKTLGFQLSGGVSASYNHNFNNPNTNLSQLRTSDANTNTFTPNLAQLMLQRSADPGGSGADRAGFRARLNFGPDARVSRARSNFRPGTDNTELDFQEMYAEYIVPVGNGLMIQVGKINTALGYETFTSWENPNYSRTFGYNLAQAFTTTGVRLTYQINPMVTVMLAVNNGWDNIEDNNKGKMVEGALTLTPHKRFTAYFYGSYAAEQSNCQGAGQGVIPASPGAPCTSGAIGTDPTAKRTILDSILTYKATDNDTFILETYYGNEGNVSAISKAHNGRWNSMYLYLIHDFNDQQQPHAFSLRLRNGIFEDAGGVRTCTGSVNTNGGNNTCANSPGAAGNNGQATGAAVFNQAGFGGIAQTLFESTNTLQYKPFPSLIVRAEFRYDKSNKNVFLYGSRAVNNQETLTLNVVYLF